MERRRDGVGVDRKNKKGRSVVLVFSLLLANTWDFQLKERKADFGSCLQATVDWLRES